MKRVLTAILLCALCAPPAWAQEPELARVPFSVQTKSAFLTGYERGNFRLFQAGVERPLVGFFGPGRPKHVLVLAEYSRTLPRSYRTYGAYESPYYRSLLEVGYTIYSLTKRLEPQDSIALATYDIDIRPVTLDENGKWNFVRSRAQVYAWLEDFLTVGYRLEPTGNEATPYSTLMQVLEGGASARGLRSLLRESERNLVVVLISGGASTFERTGWDEILRVVRNAGIPIYTVQVGFESRVGHAGDGVEDIFGTDGAVGRAWMTELARASGGRYVEIRHFKESARVAASILERAKYGYVLYFVPAPAPRRKRFEKLEVRLVDLAGVPVAKVWNPIEERWEKVKVEGREGIEYERDGRK